MKEECAAVNLADEVINEFVEKQTREAFKKLTSMQHGEGCCCHACKTHWISELNSWVQFVAPNEEKAAHYEFHLDDKGNLYQGEEPPAKAIDETLGRVLPD